ncbi:hypothetical protein GALMADRAFT_215513 [Galerina marginata CBS 339.88]|uniref:Uncharacterized protein n=1 Tax=Galerina marginata (strain CBS 339.88) TaxID=685588 RepID=A0A067SQD2_GALM3|nr:hypothetical protein GALMADRAFT_215513 [Galerina marginata CBS 339.88]
MGQFISRALRSTNELGITYHRTYETKYRGITSIKIQPNGGNLLAAASSLLIYDLSAETDGPQQFKVLSFEVGGITDLLWVAADVLVVGTTRGSLVVFSLKNEARRLFEVCSMKAHGDGASMVAVQSIAFCSKTNCLASVGQGVGSVRLWNITSDGVLASRDIPSPIAFYEPRFVGFMDNGSHVLVGFLEHILIQKFSTEPWALVEEHTLGQHQGAFDHRELGNAIVLDDNRLLVFNLKDLIFMILRSFLSLEARRSSIQAVHSSSNSSNNHDVIATASSVDGKESSLTIWTDYSHRLKVSKTPSLRPEYSTFQIVLLSVLVYVLCQLVTSFLLVNIVLFSPSPMTPIVDLNSATVDLSIALVDVDLANMAVTFPLKSTPGVFTVLDADPGSLKISEANLAEPFSQERLPPPPAKLLSSLIIVYSGVLRTRSEGKGIILAVGLVFRLLVVTGDEYAGGIWFDAEGSTKKKKEKKLVNFGEQKGKKTTPARRNPTLSKYTFPLPSAHRQNRATCGHPSSHYQRRGDRRGASLEPTSASTVSRSPAGDVLIAVGWFVHEDEVAGIVRGIDGVGGPGEQEKEKVGRGVKSKRRQH